MLVREMNRLADSAEKFDAFANVELVLVAISIQRQAVDVFHDEERQAVVGGSRIQQCGDVGVFAERGEDLNLIAEPAQDVLGIHAPPKNFYRDLLAEVGLTDGEIDVAHAAARDTPPDTVRTESLADIGIVRR